MRLRLVSSSGSVGLDAVRSGAMTRKHPAGPVGGGRLRVMATRLVVLRDLSDQHRDRHHQLAGSGVVAAVSG